MDSMPLPRPRLWRRKESTTTPDPARSQEPDLSELNTALSVLVEVFPDVQPEVFREMLVSISEESRLQVVTEALLQKKMREKWIRGRFRTPPERKTSMQRWPMDSERARQRETVAREDTFRGDSYRKAAKQVLYQEFQNISHSTIRGILAENNFSYTLSRPVIQGLSLAGSWYRPYLFWRKTPPAPDSARHHPFVLWRTDNSVHGRGTPTVRPTGSGDLNQELHEMFVAPVLSRQHQYRLHTDFTIATEVNKAEAEDADALYDCECCYGSVPFESMAACDESCHILCLDCIRRTVQEALYGQGWAQTADHERASVRCFASEGCIGTIHQDLVRRALRQGTDNEDTWHELQAKLTTETLRKSGLQLQKCPFCDYAEIDDLPGPKLRHPLAIWNHVAMRASSSVQLLFLFALFATVLFTIPLLVFGSLLWTSLHLYPPAKSHLTTSLRRTRKLHRTPHFLCQNPSCLTLSCTRCSAPWRDPHTCFETHQTSLRTTLEASATAAIKRTCPKCLLSFVKSSGCNKLVCNCGYTMCYVCRSEISTREGYSHFCQHFRGDDPGGRCAECDRCDLYGEEDEDVAVRRAVAEAERRWREENEKGEMEGERRGGDGGASVTAVTGQKMVEVLVEGAKKREWYDVVLDEVVDALITF